VNPQQNLTLHQSPRSGWLQNFAIGPLAAALLAILLYGVTLWGTYVYDDVMIVRNDPRVHHPDQWIRLWNTDYFDGGMDNLYRPLTSSSYALEWWLHGDRPWIFHGINILLHALVAATVAEFTRRILQPASIANTASLCAGLLFAAHPVHVEAVANIVGRAELLCTSLIFIGLILLCRRPLTVGRVISVVAVGILALLSKEQGILQPLLWLFFFLILWRFDPDAPAERKALKVLMLATTWIWAGYLILRERFLKFEWDRTYIDPIIQPLILSHGTDRLLMPVVLLGHYTALLLWPRHLAADYGGNVIGSIAHLSDPYFWIGSVTIFSWICAFIKCTQIFFAQRRTEAEKTNPSSSLRLNVSASQMNDFPNRLVLFCLLSLAITYGIVGNILTLIATNFAERLIYLPSAFFLIIIGIFLAYLPGKIRGVLMGIVLILASIRTFTAARDWNHPLILFQHGLAAQPQSVQLHLLVSQEYHKHGDIGAANATLDDLCRQYPDYWRAWMFRAMEDMDDGNLTDADASLKRAKKLKSDPLLLGVFGRLADLQQSRAVPARSGATRPGSVVH
jgi:hypothetical protein